MSDSGVENNGSSEKGDEPKVEGSIDTEKEEVVSNASSNKAASSSNWSNYFKKAVANVESTLDKVLQESSEINVSTPSERQTSATKQRMTMEDRLAKAVGRPSTPTSVGDKKASESSSSARTSEDSNVQQTTATTFAITSDQQEPIDPPSFDALINLSQSLQEMVSLMDLPEEQGALKTSLAELVNNLTLQQKRSDDHTSQVLGKIESLESKVKYLSQQEMERTNALKQSSSGLQKKLAEKDEQIALLFEEGQALSKKELKYMTTIKRLRNQEKESGKANENALKRAEKAEKELVDVKQKLKEQSDTLKEYSRSGDDIEPLKKERDSLKSTVMQLEQQLKDLNSKYDERAQIAQTDALNDATNRARELQEDLDKANFNLEMNKENLQVEISELQAQLRQEEESNNTLVSELRDEIKNLEVRVEHYRSMSEEASTVGGASSEQHLNLVRQIESLQSQHSISKENWHEMEASLNNRITSLENDLEEAKNQEISLRKKLKSLNETNRASVEENEKLNDDIYNLKTEVSQLQVKIGELEARVSEKQSDKEALQTRMEREVKRLEQERDDLTSRLEESEKELQNIKQLDTMSSPGPNMDRISPFSPGIDTEQERHKSSDQSSMEFDRSASTENVSGFFESRNPSITTGLGLNQQPGLLSPRQGGERASSVLTVNNSGPNIQLVGKMNNTIRRLESELSSVKLELDQMTRAKEDACKQTIELMKDNEDLNQFRQKASELEEKVKTLEEREQTTLEMLGEKSEQVNELKADVEDLKSMYRQQVEQLVDQLAAANKK